MTDVKDQGIVGVGDVTMQLSRGGFAPLANRVRAFARGRGALAHPDARLRYAVLSALALISRGADELETSSAPPWSPSMLCDDRRLRQRCDCLSSHAIPKL